MYKIRRTHLRRRIQGTWRKTQTETDMITFIIPRTPMTVNLGIWNSQSPIWANGPINWKDPSTANGFSMQVASVKVSCYMPPSPPPAATTTTAVVDLPPPCDCHTSTTTSSSSDNHYICSNHRCRKNSHCFSGFYFHVHYSLVHNCYRNSVCRANRDDKQSFTNRD
ncbi:hypothetical protein BDR26DRAFT_403557 [Obelidium mucronatum]|nr:hypothetical protein BDR26DRAFT_403557 [Obelidium mucronatum]